MIRKLIFLLTLTLLPLGGLSAVESVMKEVDALIAEGKYQSAWIRLHEHAEEEDFTDLVLKKTELCLRYYTLNNMHQIFAFSDMKEGEDLQTLRREGKAGDMRLFDPAGALTEALEKDPDRGEIDFWLGEYYFEALNLFGTQWSKPAEELKDLILTHYRSALEKGEASEELYAHLAHIELLREEWEAAGRDLKAALAYNRQEPGYYHNLAAVQINLNQLPQAEINAERAFSLYSDPVYKADSLFLASTIALYREQAEKAAAYLEQGAELSPGDYRFSDRLIRLYLSLGKYDQARKAAADLFSLYPESPENCTKIIQYFYSMDRLEETDSFFDSQIKAFKDNPEALGNLYYHQGISYAYRNLPEEARSALALAEAEFKKIYEETHPVFEIIEELKKNPQP